MPGVLRTQIENGAVPLHIRLAFSDTEMDYLLNVEFFSGAGCGGFAFCLFSRPATGWFGPFGFSEAFQLDWLSVLRLIPSIE
jgi:hypothetical protein